MSNTKQAPKVGFVSLGCPKNLVDSERILTQLRTEGYDVVPSYDDAELVVVNTCGFIDSAVQESLEAIGEALAENGKVIVTGCLGAKENQIREIHPKVLEITGPHAYEEVLGHVHKYVEKPTHNPFTSQVPAHGVKLTPRHYAYLKISEGCNHRCTFCIIPSMRGDLVSRPIGEVLAEAKRLKEAGVKEILVISQDTSAYGVDVKHRTGFYDGMPVKTSMVALCEELAKLGMWVISNTDSNGTTTKTSSFNLNKMQGHLGLNGKIHMQKDSVVIDNQVQFNHKALAGGQGTAFRAEVALSPTGTMQKVADIAITGGAMRSTLGIMPR